MYKEHSIFSPIKLLSFTIVHYKALPTQFELHTVIYVGCTGYKFHIFKHQVTQMLSHILCAYATTDYKTIDFAYQCNFLHKFKAPEISQSTDPNM